MQGLSHKGFAAAGAISVNTLLATATARLFPTGDANIIYHALGSPWYCPDLVHFLYSGQLFSTEMLLLLLRKATYYWTVIRCASVPDRLEQVDELDLEHRGFSHSITFMILLWGSMFILYLIAKDQLNQHALNLPIWLTQEIWAGCIGLMAGILLHIVADMLSKRGTKVAWPSDIPVAPLPEPLRYSTKKDNEQYALWLWIFASGFLFAASIIGL